MSTASMTAEHELVAIIRTYNEVAEQLKSSHEVLGQEVCRLREELHEKNKELARRERLAALGEMAAGVAHEIRNPLGAIGLYASLLHRDLRGQPAPMELVRKLSVGVRSMESIVGDILDFAGDSEPDFHPVPFEEVLEHALTQITAMQEEIGAYLDVDPALYTLRLRCDARQVERVFMNLVFNAMEAVGKGGHVRIRLAEDQVDNSQRGIVVEDDGPGIDSSAAQRVFNPFYSTKDSGTGLGLAIVHRIVEAHGGRITVGRSLLGGAAFTVYLPVIDGGRSVDSVGEGREERTL